MDTAPSTIFFPFIIVVIIIIVIIFVIKASEFKKNQSKIEIGMCSQDVLNLMNEPTQIRQLDDNSYMYIYEKKEFKGILRGGTRIRRIEVTFDANNKVTHVKRNKDANMSAW